MTRQIFLDVETTGLSPHQGHRIVEIGCVEAHDNKITGQVFHCYCNPERRVSPAALAVHGLDDAFLQTHPTFGAIATDLVAFVGGAEVIIHNARFDVGFLNAELHRIQGGSLADHTAAITDSLHLARRLYAGQRNDLDTLCRRFGILTASRDKHSALHDAQLLAAVYAQLRTRPANTST
ncbi:MAG: DNA polymerase III subunit epsilon [Polaromonas sp.]